MGGEHRQPPELAVPDVRPVSGEDGWCLALRLECVGDCGLDQRLQLVRIADIDKFDGLETGLALKERIHRPDPLDRGRPRTEPDACGLLLRSINRYRIDVAYRRPNPPNVRPSRDRHEPP